MYSCINNQWNSKYIWQDTVSLKSNSLSIMIVVTYSSALLSFYNPALKWVVHVLVGTSIPCWAFLDYCILTYMQALDQQFPRSRGFIHTSSVPFRFENCEGQERQLTIRWEGIRGDTRFVTMNPPDGVVYLIILVIENVGYAWYNFRFQHQK